MATVTRVPVREYLHNSYRPDCDYVDGELQERNVGEIEHSEMQMAIAEWFQQHRKEWKLRVLPEVRIQVSPTRFRVADICVVPSDNKEKGVVRTPPLIVVEILSPEDRVGRYQERLADYRRMGIQHVWIVDPHNRRGYDCSTESWLETLIFRIPNSPVAMDLSAIFSEL